jgi:hypothetical protein
MKNSTHFQLLQHTELYSYIASILQSLILSKNTIHVVLYVFKNDF